MNEIIKAIKERRSVRQFKPDMPAKADLEQIAKYAKMLNAAGRSNVKALGNAAQRGLIDYQLEVQRVNAYLKKGDFKFKGDEKEMRFVYDISEFYDLWFAKEEKDNDQNA